MDTLCLKHAISHTDGFILKGKKQTQTNKYQQKFSLEIALINVETVLQSINFHDYELSQGNKDDHSLRQTFTWVTFLFQMPTFTSQGPETEISISSVLIIS